MKSAICLLDNTSNSEPGGLSLDQTIPDQGAVRAFLKYKHPHVRPANPSVLLPIIEQSDTSSSWHPAIFESLNGAAVHSSALHVEGSDLSAWHATA